MYVLILFFSLCCTEFLLLWERAQTTLPAPCSHAGYMASPLVLPLQLHHKVLVNSIWVAYVIMTALILIIHKSYYISFPVQLFFFSLVLITIILLACLVFFISMINSPQALSEVQFPSRYILIHQVIHWIIFFPLKTSVPATVWSTCSLGLHRLPPKSSPLPTLWDSFPSLLCWISCFLDSLAFFSEFLSVFCWSTFSSTS